MIYLDNAATSYPKPDFVYEKVVPLMKRFGANPGRSGYRFAVESEMALDNARHRIAKFFNAKNSERLVFTLNATDALNIALKGILRQGDHVITSYLEHNSVSRPLNRLAEDSVISLTRIPHSSEGYIDPSEVKKSLRPNTRLVALSHGSNVIGAVQPILDIGKILHDTETLFLVDAAQTAGVIPIDVQEMFIDLLAFTGHKSLFGPMGTGGLLVGEKAELSHWREGGTGGDSSSALHPEEFPHRLEGGTPNTAGILALAEGVSFVENKKPGNIHSHEMTMVERFINELREDDRFIIYGPQKSSSRVSTVSINIKGLSPQDACIILDQSFEISVRSGLHCSPYAHKSIGTYPEGTIRLSPGYFNTMEDIESLLKALRAIAL